MSSQEDARRTAAIAEERRRAVFKATCDQKECKKAAISWLERLRNEPEEYYENLKFFNQYVSQGNLELHYLVTKDHPEGTSKYELELLRKKHYAHAALITLEAISRMKKSDQVEGNPVYDLYQAGLKEDMEKGGLTREFLSKLAQNRRETDLFAEFQKAPPLPPEGTPERKLEEDRRDGCLKTARRWLKKLQEDKEMTQEVYRHYLKNLGAVMHAGYLSLSDVDSNVSRADIDRLRPSK